MERKGNNQFLWESDTLKTINKDILCIVDPPIPVSLRLWELPKDVVKSIEKILRVKWSILLIQWAARIQRISPISTVRKIQNFSGHGGHRRSPLLLSFSYLYLPGIGNKIKCTWYVHMYIHF
jgi:hypothetical protein